MDILVVRIAFPLKQLCPAPGCKSPFGELTKESLVCQNPHLCPILTKVQPSNWIASQFFDAATAQPAKMCQICKEDGIQKEAAYWCESCSKSSSPEYFCHECVVSEHSNRANRNHTRVPLEQAPQSFSVSSCKKHNLPEDSFCFDDDAFLCQRCRDKNHKGHATKFLVEHEDEVKQDLKSIIAVLRDFRQETREETNLQSSRKKQLDRLADLEAEIAEIKQFVESMDSRIKQIQESKAKALSGSLLLTRCLQEYPIRDLFDVKKLEMLKNRVIQT